MSNHGSKIRWKFYFIADSTIIIQLYLSNDGFYTTDWQPITFQEFKEKYEGTQHKVYKAFNWIWLR